MHKIPIILLLMIFNSFDPLYAMDIWDACITGNIKRVKFLIEQDRTLVNAKNQWQQAPLHYASYWGHTKLAALLLQHKTDVNAQDNIKRTPLHKTSTWGNTETATLLLQHNADVNAQDKWQHTSLHYAASKGHTEIAALLLQHKTDVNAQDNDQETPLHDASCNDHPKTMKLLLSHGATPHKPINLFSEHGKYSQIYAQRYESWICKTFLSRKTIALLLSLIGRQKITDTPLLPKDICNLIADYALADEVQEWEQFKNDHPDVAALARIELP